MSVINNKEIECTCGEKLTIEVASMINITTHPRYWPSIYSGELNSVLCNKCNIRLFWPMPFIFLDTERKMFVNVLMTPLKGGVYMVGHTLDFIKNYRNVIAFEQLHDLRGYSIGTVLNLDDLKCKIHARAEGLDIGELQFVEYLLETRNSCDMCNSTPLKLLYERSDKENHVFRTICFECKRVSMIEYPIKNYKEVLDTVKLAAIKDLQIENS